MKTTHPESGATSNPDSAIITHPTPAHPGYEVLGEFGLPSVPNAPFAIKPTRRPYCHLDAGEHGLNALALNQCQDIAHLQSLLIADLAEGVSYLDAFDLQAMEERSHVYLEIAHKQADLLNTHLQLFNTQTNNLQLAANMLKSLDCATLIGASDSDGELKQLGLSDEQFALMSPMFAAPDEGKTLSDLRLSSVYTCFAKRYTAYEHELTQVVQDFLKAKQQAGRLQFYVACLQLLSGRAKQIAGGMEQEVFNHASEHVTEDQANESRAAISQKLQKLGKMPLVEVLEQFQ